MIDYRYSNIFALYLHAKFIFEIENPDINFYSIFKSKYYLKEIESGKREATNILLNKIKNWEK